VTSALNSPRGCAKQACYAPDTGCILGYDYGSCDKSLRPEAGPATDERAAPAGGLPWTGLGLGSDDVAAVAGVGRPVVVALAGEASAGKTTALAASFVAMRHGRQLAGATFAGSFTVLGWQLLSSYMLWPPYGAGFPPHTTATDHRSPCLLHIRLRDARSGTVREVLLSDVPGEWFSAWAVDEDDGPGAAWLAARADVFVLFADCERLASAKRGEARGMHAALARRVQRAAAGRPVLPVLSKADIQLPAAMRDYLSRLHQELFGASAMPVSTQPHVGAPALAVMDAAIRGALRARRSAPGPDGAHRALRRDDDPFLGYRSASLTTRMAGADG
jgi:hypothetical protein